MNAHPASPDVVIIYDGECPFCSSYVRLMRLRKAVGPVELVDARQRPDIVRELSRGGIDLDEGMVVKTNGETLHGADAVHWLSLHSSGNGIGGRLNRLLLGNQRIAHWTYPAMRAGRNAALRLLGRRKIRPSQ
jgi:predicted DCC family thiol-disulfide oxidoreductase YuxK